MSGIEALLVCGVVVLISVSISALAIAATRRIQ